MKYMSPWIFTTNQCNLRCPYCYVKWNDNKMSKKTYDKINSIYLEMLSTGELDFMVYRIAGGEPTLVFNEWRSFVEEFLTKSNSKGFVSIITNLTILTEEMLNFFKQYKDKIGYNYTLPEKCKDCSISEICGGGCKIHNKEINKNFTCDIIKTVVLYMIRSVLNKKI